MSTRAELLAEIAAQFPDNTSRSITPAKLRQVCENLANSATVPDTDGDALTAEIEAAAEAAASAEVSAHVAATDPHGDRAAAAADATTKANAALAAAEATVAAALAAYTPPAQTVTADSITDAGTAGKAVLTAETHAQGRTALGVGLAPTPVQRTALSGTQVVLIEASAQAQVFTLTANTTVKLPPTGANTWAFAIFHGGGAFTLSIKKADDTLLTALTAGDASTVVWDGTALGAY